MIVSFLLPTPLWRIPAFTPSSVYARMVANAMDELPRCKLKFWSLCGWWPPVSLCLQTCTFCASRRLPWTHTTTACPFVCAVSLKRSQHAHWSTTRYHRHEILKEAMQDKQKEDYSSASTAVLFDSVGLEGGRRLQNAIDKNSRPATSDLEIAIHKRLYLLRIRVCAALRARMMLVIPPARSLECIGLSNEVGKASPKVLALVDPRSSLETEAARRGESTLARGSILALCTGSV